MINCSLPCGCGECEWEPRKGRPIIAPGQHVDCKYADGKVFLNKPLDNCYWGSDSLITHWRLTQEV